MSAIDPLGLAGKTVIIEHDPRYCEDCLLGKCAVIPAPEQ